MIFGWTWTGAFYRALAVVALPLGLGLSTGRADLVVLAAPLWLMLVLALVGRRAGPSALADPEAVAGVDAELVTKSVVEVNVELTDTADAELVSVLLPASTARPTGTARTVSGGDRLLVAQVSTRSWGPTLIARPDIAAIGPDGLRIAGPEEGEPVTELVLPAAAAAGPLPLPPILGGWAGAHLSRRPGQGNDLIDLRDYQPGDRMRSVHWRAYARHGKLYTRRTLSDADADITLCLDVRVAVGPRVPPPPATPIEKTIAAITESVRLIGDARSVRRGGQGTTGRLYAQEAARQTSLDHTVHAATAVAQTQLRIGDRVSVMTISADRRSIRPGTGTRHFHRVRHFLANLSPSSRRLLPVAHWNLRSTTVVIICSPLTDDAIVDAVAECAGRGHRAIVIDTMPQDAIIAAASIGDLDHLRILVPQRERRIAKVRHAGVPVVRWELGKIDAALAAAQYAIRRRG